MWKHARDGNMKEKWSAVQDDSVKLIYSLKEFQNQEQRQCRRRYNFYKIEE